MRSNPAGAPRLPAAPLAVLLALLAALALTLPAVAAAGYRTHAPTDASASASQTRTAAERVLRYWTPERMASARPLDLVVDGRGDAELRVGQSDIAMATASFVRVATPEVPPYSVNGRIFIRRGNLRGYCSGTAINTPTRALVLTAGHCVNSGHEGGRRTVWSNFLEFVPA